MVQEGRVCGGEEEGLECQDAPYLNPITIFDKGLLQDLSFPAGKMGVMISTPSSGTEDGKTGYMQAKHSVPSWVEDKDLYVELYC